MTKDVHNNALAAALLPPKVVSINSPSELVINRGEKDGLREGQHVLIYTIGDEIIDPDTNESLGRLEIVRGKGRIVHLQQRMATVENLEKTKREPSWTMLTRVPHEEPAPFRNALIGDLARVL